MECLLKYSHVARLKKPVWERFVVFVHTVQAIKARVPQASSCYNLDNPPPLTAPTPPHPSLPPRPLHTIFSGCDDIPGEQDQTAVLGFNTALIFL